VIHTPTIVQYIARPARPVAPCTHLLAPCTTRSSVLAQLLYLPSLSFFLLGSNNFQSTLKTTLAPCYWLLLIYLHPLPDNLASSSSALVLLFSNLARPRQTTGPRFHFNLPHRRRPAPSFSSIRQRPQQLPLPSRSLTPSCYTFVSRSFEECSFQHARNAALEGSWLRREALL
jgi:hypothetical protein